MSALEERSSNEFTIQIDSTRSIGGNAASDGTNVVLVLEDPHSVSVVEITQDQLSQVITELSKLRKEAAA